jgi:hypothetical protein
MSGGERPAGRPAAAAGTSAFGWGEIRTASLVWLVALAGDLAVVALWLPYASSSGNALSFVIVAPVMVVYASLGWLIVRHRPGHRVGWLLLATPVLMITFALGIGLGTRLADARGSDDPLAGALFTIAIATLVPLFVLGVAMLPILFPDGRLPGPRWRWPVGAVLLGTGLTSACFVLAPPTDPTALGNPFSPPGAPPALYDLAGVLGNVAALLASVLAVAAVVVRFRRGRGDERQQLKWMLAAVALAVGLNIPSFFGLSSDLLGVAGAIALLLVPVAVTMAILRYRLYDIDRLISRTISYALVTLVLVATFALGDLVLQTLLSTAVQGDTIAIAASTLLTFVLAQPVWRRIRTVVDRRFDRARVDAEGAVAAFVERQRDQVDLPSLIADVRSTADASLRPASIGIWLRRDPERPGSS